MLKSKLELLLLLLIPTFIDAHEKSRLKSLSNKLQVEILKILKKLPAVTEQDRHKLDLWVTRWGSETKYFKNINVNGELVSFCLGMMNKSSTVFPKDLQKCVILIAQHLDNGDRLPEDSRYQGMLAAYWEHLTTLGGTLNTKIIG